MLNHTDTLSRAFVVGNQKVCIIQVELQSASANFLEHQQRRREMSIRFPVKRRRLWQG